MLSHCCDAFAGDWGGQEEVPLQDSTQGNHLQARDLQEAKIVTEYSTCRLQYVGSNMSFECNFEMISYVFCNLIALWILMLRHLKNATISKVHPEYISHCPLDSMLPHPTYIPAVMRSSSYK